MYLWVQCVWFPVMISTFLLMFLHQIFYKSTIVMENKHASDGTVCVLVTFIISRLGASRLPHVSFSRQG